MENRNNLICKIQEYNFTAYDLLLYLDTHPDDRKAFSMFQEMVKKTKELIAEYEKEYGPLTPYSAAGQNCFNWLNSPWPWEKEGNC